MATMSYLNSPEWQAYRKQAFDRAYQNPDTILPGDYRAAVQPVLRPGAHRVHASYFWYNTLVVAGAVLFAFAITGVGIVADQATDGKDLGISLGILAVLFGLGVLVISAITALSSYLSWRHLSFELTPEEISVHSGVISKKHFHIPYQRIQAVNQSMGLIQRLIGVCNIKIDTAGGSANEAMSLNYLRVSDAEILRTELFRRKKILAEGGSLDPLGNAVVHGAVVPSAWMVACCNNDYDTALRVLGVDPQVNAQVLQSHVEASRPAQVSGYQVSRGADGKPKSNLLDMAEGAIHDVRGVFAGAETNTGQVSFEARLSNKELAFAAISGSVEAMGATFAGVAVALLSVISFAESMFGDFFDMAMEQGISSVASGVVNHSLASLVVPAISIALVVVLAMWVISALSAMLKYGGFSARRREGRIEIEHGILKREFKGVGVDRIQGVVIKQSLVRKWLGYCELSVSKIESIAGSDSGEARSVSPTTIIHPFVKVSEVPQLLAGLLPEFAAEPETPIRPAPVALRRGIVRKTVLRSGNFWCFVCVALVHVALLVCVSQVSMDADDRMILALATNVILALYPVFALVAVINVVGSVLWYRGSSMGYNRNFLKVVNAGFTTVTELLPRKKIQFAQVKQNPLQRMGKIGRVQAITAGGIGQTKVELWDVAEADAFAYMDWVRPRVGAPACRDASPTAQ